MQELIIATGNRGKLAEIEKLCQDLPVHIRPQADLGIESPEETGLTFVENALLKARFASRASGRPALADDSGLVVPALGGAPGLYSARYAGEGASDEQNMQKLLTELASQPRRSREAYFFCVVVVLAHAEDPAPLIAEGRWRGTIALAPEGDHGFGYDPVFVPAEFESEPDRKTAAQLERATKNRYSHRGAALRHLATRLPNWIANLPEA